MKPTLSIGIPTFNQGEYLEETILSVLNQTVKPYEFVICNNHSTDGITDEVLKKYKNDIKVIEPSKILPMMENWNFLCKNLTGDYISLLSSDDFYEPNFIEAFYANLKPDGVLYRVGINLVNKDGDILGSSKIRSARKVQNFPGNFYEQLIGPKLSFAGFVVKSEAMRRVGFFDERLKLNGDWGLWLRLAPLGSFYLINKILSNYRGGYRPTLAKERFEMNILDILYVYENIQKEIIEKYRLKKGMQRNSIKLHIYRFEKTMISSQINDSDALLKFKEFFPGNYIKSEFEYRVRSQVQRLYEGLIKR
jgi:glycosyltransferase involved in cell wall biosynthesis